VKIGGSRVGVVLVAVLAGVVVGGAGCGRPAPPESGASAKYRPETRDELLARLVARADAQADAGDFGPAEASYSLALLYADDPAVRAKLSGVAGKAGLELTPAQSKRFDMAVRYLAAAAADWPAPTPAAEEVELRILLDSPYLRDHRRRRAGGPAGGPGVEVFVGPGNEPVHPRTLEKEFGPPTSRVGDEVFTYGRLRFVFGPDMFSAATLLRPVPRP
jgi:hypothetical protein